MIPYKYIILHHNNNAIWTEIYTSENNHGMEISSLFVKVVSVYQMPYSQSFRYKIRDFKNGLSLLLYNIDWSCVACRISVSEM